MSVKLCCCGALREVANHKLQRAGADAAKSHMTLRRLVPSFYVGPVNETLPILSFRKFLPKTRWQTREETMENDIQSQFPLVLRLGWRTIRWSRVLDIITSLLGLQTPTSLLSCWQRPSFLIIMFYSTRIQAHCMALSTKDFRRLESQVVGGSAIGNQDEELWRMFGWHKEPWRTLYISSVM